MEFREPLLYSEDRDHLTTVELNEDDILVVADAASVFLDSLVIGSPSYIACERLASLSAAEPRELRLSSTNHQLLALMLTEYAARSTTDPERALHAADMRDRAVWELKIAQFRQTIPDTLEELYGS
jgi:hypothetical protein